MIDFHTHILPGIDDGAKNPAESLSMLKNCYELGIDTVVATSHCYITDKHSIDRFLKRREKAYEQLKEAMAADGGPFPKIVPGSEVHLFLDFSHFDRVEELCIEGTNYILVEMPYKDWDPTLYDCLYNLQVKNMRPIMAHIERFSSFEMEFPNLFNLDLYYQVNAESFFKAPYKRFVANLFENNMIQLVGSDMHNLAERNQKLGQAKERIEKVYGPEFWEYLQRNASAMLENQPAEAKPMERLSLWKKLTL